MLKGNWKLIAMLFVSLFVVLGLTACGDDDVASGADESALKDEYPDVSDKSFDPFDFKEDDKYVGCGIDLIHAIADEAGFKIDFETTNFDGIIPGLQTGQFDIDIAGIGITEERAEKIVYSD